VSNQLEQRCKILERSLQQCEEKFARFFHAAATAVAITTIDKGVILDVNESFAALTGYDRKELLCASTKAMGLWVNPEQRDELIRQLQQKRKRADLEVQLRTKNGETRTALFSAEIVSIDEEPCLLTMAKDISERKKMEEALKKSEEKYRMLVEHSLQALAIVKDSRFVFCNSRFAEISGYSVDELLSRSPDQVMGMIHREDRKLIEERQRDRMAGKPVPAHFECRAIKKNGAEVWLEVYSSIIDYNGKPALQLAVMDITERKKSAEELQRALVWQKALFEGSHEAILISDADSRLVEANTAACKLTGYSREELLNMYASDLSLNSDASVRERIHDRILAGEDVLEETKILTKDGRQVDVEIGHRLVTISGVPYVHAIARDITSRVRLEAQLLQAQKMEAIGVLAGGVAHDFNNLLSVIKGYAELLLEGIAPDDPRAQDLEKINKAAQHAASLTSQLLAFSRKQILQPKILNLNEIVMEMSTMLRRLIGEDIELLTITPPDLRLINADPVQIQQIVMNLAINARDAMPFGGILTIETKNADLDGNYNHGHSIMKSGPYVMMAISDNGSGMDPETQARIFEPFFTTKVQGKGAGLGLSTVYGIVKQSNGFIWVYSEPGKGTTFKIYFPRARDAAAGISDTSSPDLEMRGTETILVVEDESSVRTLASRILRDRRYKVLEASNGKEALEIAQSYQGEIHLVLTDVIMPGMSGGELVSKLESIRPGSKVLYVSGYTTDTVVHHGVLDSGVAFLQKPFSVNGLVSKVREVIESDHGHEPSSTLSVQSRDRKGAGAFL
jgi:two-component system cell cycle sensor histidine kinase/response regulator CckA